MAGNALYDVGMRLRAAELHDGGHGRTAIAALLGMPEETVREWLCTYRSAGIEVLAMMGKKHTAYSFVSVNLFFTSFAKQARRSRKGGFTGCANVFSPIPVTA